MAWKAVCIGLVCLACGHGTGTLALGAAEAKAKTNTTRPATKPAPVWPKEVQDIQYLSQADNTQQPAMYYEPANKEAVPLLVALHTWSADYTQPETAYARWAMQQGWVMIRPNFRGPNQRPEACGSDLAVADIVSAVEWAKQKHPIDTSRIYLVGCSGGAHMAMLMAGRHPEIWAGVSTWCGISDLAEWYRFHSSKGIKDGYALKLLGVFGAPPGTSPQIDEAYRHRSPLTWLENARNVPMDLNAGIADGYNGSVPIAHTLRAYNRMVPTADQIPAEEIQRLGAQPALPEGFAKPPTDELYGKSEVLYRRLSGVTRVTLFQGGHSSVLNAALSWLAQQRKGSPVNWHPTAPAIPVTNMEIAPSGK